MHDYGEFKLEKEPSSILIQFMLTYKLDTGPKSAISQGKIKGDLSKYGQ